MTRRQLATGIRKVLSGEVKEFGLKYPCHSPNQQRWPLNGDLNEFCALAFDESVQSRKERAAENFSGNCL